MHKFILKIKLRSHQRLKWFTPDIQHHLNCTHTLRRRHNDKASLFNQYFHLVFTISPPNSVLIALMQTPPPITLSNISSAIFNALHALDISKAMEIEIGPKVLKSCALARHEPLFHLFSLTLSEHNLPANWHVNLITPIHKSGDKTSVKFPCNVPYPKFLSISMTKQLTLLQNWFRNPNLDSSRSAQPHSNFWLFLQVSTIAMATKLKWMLCI